MPIDECNLRAKVTGCWLGKAVGGTLGMPFEGRRERLNLSYYDPVPTDMVPNDDLDLQVVHATLLHAMAEPRVGRGALEATWRHVGMAPDEYGVCKRNLALGLHAPQTGAYDNWFTDGMGAAIRTELWACLAAPEAELAAAYAREDACMDHAGEGVHAAAFLAALEAGAFVQRDPDVLLDTALACIPRRCAIARGVDLTRRLWRRTGDVLAVWEAIRTAFASDNFTDVRRNVPYIVLGWLAGEGNFGRSICAAVNCGEDTDCTGASLGALLGILAPDGIGERWLRPIGRELVLSPSITGIEHPPTLDALTDLVLSLRKRVGGRPPAPAADAGTTEPLGIRATVGFGEAAALEPRPAAPRMPDAARQVVLPGTIATWPADAWGGPALLVRYRFTLPADQPVRVLFNTAEPVRVYLDGRFLFGRDGGPVVPAFHRAPPDQVATVELAGGAHELLAAIARPWPPREVTWIVGLAEGAPEAVCAEWLVGAFERSPGGRAV